MRWFIAAAAAVLLLLYSRSLENSPGRDRMSRPEPRQAENEPPLESNVSAELALCDSGMVVMEPLPEVSLSRIEGRIVDSSGTGIGQVRVRLYAENAPRRWYEYDPTLGGVASEEDGSFRFPRVPAGLYSVQAVIRTWERDVTYTCTNVATGSTSIRIRISRRPLDLPITVGVKAVLPDGSLLPSGSMTIWGIPGQIEGTIENGYGEIQITDTRPPPNQTQVRLLVVPAGDGAGAAPTTKLIEFWNGSYEIRLDRGRTLTGTVLLDGEPCSVPLWADGVGGTPGQYACQADAHGRFEFQNLPEGEVSLHPSPYANSTCKLARAVQVRTDAKDVLVSLTKPVSLHGRVIPPPGRRLDSVGLKLRGPWAPGRHLTTNGRFPDVGDEFNVGALTPGSSCELWVWGTFADGASFVPRVVPFTAGAGSLDIEVEAGHSIRGHVVRTDGTPVVGAGVETRRPVAMMWRQHDYSFGPYSRTNGKGMFDLSGIHPDGRYLVVHSSGLVQVGPPPLVRGGANVRVVMAAPERIAGRVVDDQGRDLYAITVDHWHADPNARRFGWLPGRSVDGDGWFRLSVAPGRHVIYVWSNDWKNRNADDDRYALATVEAGATELRLSLRPGKTVRGRATLADGSPARCQVRIEGEWGVRRRWSRDDGSFVFRGVPPGRCSIAARRDLGPELLSNTLHVEAGGPPALLVLR